jgi:hypothetical protein
MSSHWYWFGSRLGAIALVGLSTVVARAAEDEQNKPQGVVEQAESLPGGQQKPNPQPPGWIGVTVQGPEAFAVRVPLPDYWLGLDAAPASEAMCSQLKLDGSYGLVVERLVEEGPAAKGGLKQYDIILSAGDKKLRELIELVNLLNQGKDQEIEFQVIRCGEKQTVKVKPEKRPEPKADEDVLRGWAGGNGKAVEMLREQLGKAGMPMRMQFFHPGIMLPAGAVTAPAPENLHMHIDKQGSKPAKIVVERGDERWETTEDQLDKLPNDVRPHVEVLLGRMPMPKFDVEVDPSTAAAPLGVPVPPGTSERLEKRLDELSRRMEKMGEQLEDLRDDDAGAPRNE